MSTSTNTFLRDFIEERVGPECGGSGTGSDTTPIFQRLDELERSVARLEEGTGLTITHSEFVVLPSVHMGESLQMVVPTEGIITRLSVLFSAPGITTVTLTLHHGESVTDYPVSFRASSIAETSVLSIPAYSGDWLELTWTTPEVAEGGTAPIVHLATLSLQLPDKIYSVERSDA